MRLTKITPLNEGRQFRLELEDGSELRCGPNELMDLGLSPGLELGPEALDALREACGAYEARMKAAALLSSRAMSAGELRRKLAEKGASPEHAEAAAARMQELGIIDEAAYAEMIVRRCTAKGYGRRRAEQELMHRMVPRELWAEALDGLSDAGAALDALISARWREDVPAEEQRNKLSAWLQRRGYGWEEIRAALERRDRTRDD